MFQRIITILLFCLTIVMPGSYAALPIITHTTAAPATPTTNITNTDQGSATAALPGNEVEQTEAQGNDGNEQRPRAIKNKRRGVAILLAVLGLFYIQGLHRLYLGHTVTGLIMMLGPAVSIGLGALIAALLGTSILGVAIVVLVCSWLAVYVWQIVDLARIGSGKLRPKWGYYQDEVDRVKQWRERSGE